MTLMESRLNSALTRAKQQKNNCLDIEAKLTQAKARRQKVDENREYMMNARNNKAFRRAKQRFNLNKINFVSSFQKQLK